MANKRKTESAVVDSTEVTRAEVEPTEVEHTEVEPTEVEPTVVEPTEVEPTEVEPTEVKPIYTAIAQGWDPKNREVMLWATDDESVTYKVTKEATAYTSDITTSSDEASTWFHDQIESSQNQ